MKINNNREKLQGNMIYAPCGYSFNHYDTIVYVPDLQLQGYIVEIIYIDWYM